MGLAYSQKPSLPRSCIMFSMSARKTHTTSSSASSSRMRRSSMRPSAATAGRDETLRNQLKRINLSEKTLKMFETDEVDLQLLLDLDAESLAEVEFHEGERERLVEWLKAVKALKRRCAELDKAIP